MKMKSACKIYVILFGMILLLQITYANCRKEIIIPFVDGRELYHVKKSTIRDGAIEICAYKIKYSRKNDDYYMYTLLNEGRVVYCGITYNLERRAGEHSNINRGEYKVFDQMIATGSFDEDKARDKEKACVCKYDPEINKSPVCHTQYIFGGDDGVEYHIE